MNSMNPKAKKASCFFIITAIALCIFSPGPNIRSAYGQSLAENHEDQGQAAEEKGQLREALKHYISALQLGHGEERRLREKIIKLVQRLDPPPAVPGEAEKCMAYGKVAVRRAQSQADYERAAQEFQKAVNIAPWLAEAYFNLAIVQEKAYQYDAAIRNLNFYLLAKPDAPDARELRAKIYELEYAKDHPMPKELVGEWHKIYGDKGTLIFRIEAKEDKILLYGVDKIGEFWLGKKWWHNTGLADYEFSLHGFELRGRKLRYIPTEDICPGKFGRDWDANRCLRAIPERAEYVGGTGAVSRDRRIITFRYRDRYSGKDVDVEDIFIRKR